MTIMTCRHLSLLFFALTLSYLPPGRVSSLLFRWRCSRDHLVAHYTSKASSQHIVSAIEPTDSESVPAQPGREGRCLVIALIADGGYAGSTSVSISWRSARDHHRFAASKARHCMILHEAERGARQFQGIDNAV